MSTRGIEIHNGELVFPEGMPPELHLGTEASPLTQLEAAQVVISAVINAIALGGNVEAGIFKVIASASLTGDLKGLRAGVTVNDGVTVTPSGAALNAVFGAQINVSILGTGIVTGRVEGLRIEMSSALGSETQSAFEGIFISNYNLGTQQPNGYYFIRMQENGTYTVHYAFYIRPGVGGIDYLAFLHGVHPAWNVVGTPSVETGWIKLLVGGIDRWLKLYSTAP